MKSIKIYDNYILYSNGDLFSLYRNKYIKPRKDRAGYLYLNLYINRKQKTKKVHRLVAEHFIPNLENKPTVNHKDGNKLNNNIENLEWNTWSENNKHAFTMKLRKPLARENHNLVKLSEDNITDIRNLFLTKKYTFKDLSYMFNISDSQIRRIVRNENWKDNNYIVPPIKRKIDEIDVIYIRYLYNNYNISRKELSKMFNISCSSIGYIVTNKIWNNININIEISPTIIANYLKKIEEVGSTLA